MNEELEQPEKEPEMKVSDWVKKFSASEKTMKADFLPKYQLAKERLRAEHEVKGRGTRKFTHEQVNLVKSIGESFVNSVYYKAPNCNLTAREEIDHVKVENTEIATNDWLKDKKVKKVVKRSVWDAFLGGFGGVFIDYVYDDMDDPERPLLRPQETVTPEGQIVLQQVPEVDEAGKPLFERIVLKNEITIQRLRPDLVRFPKGFDFDNYQESPWIGFDLIQPIDEVKNNPNFDKEVSEKIEGEKYESISSGKSLGKGEQSDDLYAKISYAFIKPQSPNNPFKLFIFCHKYTEKPLSYMDFKKGHIGYPLKFVYFNPLDDDCSYPNGDPWNIESQLNAVDDWWQKVAKHIRRSNPKVLYDLSITEKEAGKLKSNNDNELVGIKNPQGKDLRAMVMNLESAGYPKDLDSFLEVARGLISEISPKTNLSRGSGKDTDTATEAKIMQAGEVIDIDARIDDVGDFIKDIILDVAGIMEQSLVAPITIQKEVPSMIEGQPPQMMSQEIGSEGFTSKINCDVDVESMQSQNKDVMRRQLIDALGLFTQLKPFMDMLRMAPDPKFWIERVMETMNIRNIDKGFVQIPNIPMPVPVKGGEKQPEGIEPQDPGITEMAQAQRA